MYVYSLIAALPSINVVKSLGAVIPSDIWLCPVGGVTPDNVVDYLDVGTRGCGLGSTLYKKGQLVAMTKLNVLAFVAAWKNYQGKRSLGESE